MIACRALLSIQDRKRIQRVHDCGLACDDIESAGVEVGAAAPARFADETTSAIDDCNL